MPKRTLALSLTLLCLLLFSACSRSAGPESATSTVTVIEGATLIDGTGKAPVAGTTIVLDGPRIREIGKKGELKTPAGARVIDAEGKYVLPGLIDAHVHYNKPWLHRLYLANGVTSVRDLGSSVEEVKPLSAEIAAGKVLAPRLFFNGTPINKSSIKASGGTARELTEKLVKEGVIGIKVTGFTEAQLKDITEVAHAAGLLVYGHTGPKVNKEAPGTMVAVNAGLDGVEHVIQMVEDCLDKKVVLPRNFPGFDTGSRGPLFRYYYANMLPAFNPALLDKLIQRMVEKHTYLDATLVNYERNFAMRNTPELAADPHLKYMPEDRADRYGHYEAADYEAWKKVIEIMKQATYKFYKAGGFLVVGTDSQASSPDGALPGWSLHEEMAELVNVGIPPMDVLKAATLSNAQIMKQEKELGTVEAGKLADLLIVDADPLQDIRNTQKIYRVVRGGQILDPQQLLQDNVKEYGERKNPPKVF